MIVGSLRLRRNGLTASTRLPVWRFTWAGAIIFALLPPSTAATSFMLNGLRAAADALNTRLLAAE
jgi:hypothetical protein